MDVYLGKVDDVLCLLRRPGDGRGGGAIADAGFRRARPGPGFERRNTKVWTREPLTIDRSRVIDRAYGMVQCEYPVWICPLERLTSPSQVRLFDDCLWHGWRVRPIGWPLDEEAGERVLCETSNEELPTAQRVYRMRQKGERIPEPMLREQLEEWRESLDELKRYGWRPQGEYRDFLAVGPVLISELSARDGEVPSDWQRPL